MKEIMSVAYSDITKMYQNFGQLFCCQLVNSKVSTFNLPTDSKKREKILCISDTHLGATINYKDAIQQFIPKVKQIIQSEGITMVCHLGDLVDGSLPQGEEVLELVLRQFMTLRVPVYCIGGNHDREFFSKVNWPSGNNVHISQALAMVISIPNGQKDPLKIFLAHDLANNYRVRDQYAFAFISWIKDGCKNTIKPSDWLLTGHIHTTLISHSNKLGCVGQFSPENGVYACTILDLGSEVAIRTHYLIK